ncbi:MAG: GlsB/YeaQ/YmgE family stress response membrane protein [Acidimicrobiia bacterium]|nr:GlsB/YeaQ/YmgE family stress response membrane protein [Acidimicrobiia bacterium]
MITFLLYLILIGLIAGAIARLLVPGPDSMGILPTIAIGIVGSFVGGFLGALLFGADGDEGYFQASGIIGSIIGALVVLLVVRATSRAR